MNGPKYLLDTNLVVGLLKGRPEAVNLRDRLQLDFANCAVSQITRMELLSYPKLQVDEERHIRAFVDSCAVVLLEEPVEIAAISLRRSTGARLPDAIIAASAKVKGLKLLTLDHDLERKLEKWLEV